MESSVFRIKSLTLFGFKSFAHRTKLEFHEGITAIVGPNGCGKSNISDAFRWVFGEQSPQSLRGHKMQDVIFAGTSTRKAQNLAEVTISFTNAEGKLLQTMNDVDITRRLLRTGESQYFINKQKVRLKDVLDLFLDSGIGRDSFAIFEQGKIDQVIKETPLERRIIFEETAGIVRFLQRKKESLKKLSLLDENLLRLNDLVQEVEKQVASLEKQAEKAKSFKELKASQEIFEKQIAYHQAVLLNESLFSFNEKINRLKLELETVEASRKKGISLYEREKKEVDELFFQLKKRQELQFEIRNQQTLLIQEKESEKKWVLENRLKGEKAFLERQSLLEATTQLSSQRKILDEKISDTQAFLKELQAKLEADQKKLALLDEAFKELLEEEKKRQTLKFSLSQKKWGLESDLKESSLKLSLRKERREKVVQEIEEGKALFEKSEKSVRDKKELSLNLKKQESEFKEKLEEVKKKSDLAKEAFLKSSQKLREVNGFIYEKKMRCQTIQKMKEEYEGVSTSSKIVLKEKKATLLSEAFSDVEDERLLQVLRPYAQTLFVQNDEQLETLLGYVKLKNLKELSFFSLSRLKEGESLEEYFLNRGTFDQEAPPLFKEFGVVDRLGVLFYQTSGENNVFLRERELRVLKGSLKELEERASFFKEEEKKCQEIHEAFLEERGGIESNLKRLERVLFQEEVEWRRLVLESEGMKKRGEALQKEIAFLEEEVGVYEALFLEKGRFLKELLEEMRGFEFEEKNKEVELKKQKELFLEAKGALQSVEREIEKNKAQSFQLKHELELIDLKEKELFSLGQRLQQEVEESRKKEALFKENEGIFDKGIEALQKRLDEVIFCLKEEEEVVFKKREGVKRVEKEIEDLRLSQESLRVSVAQIEGEKALVENRLALLEKQFFDRFQKGILEEVKEPLKVSLTSLEKKLGEVNRKLEEAGDINFTAITAYDEQKARASFLNTQMSDLVSSKEELSLVISDLETKSKKAFKETFEAVRTHFQANFQVLFNGGAADLSLTEEGGGILERGIEISAKPPGKQMQSIQLLSGGEKCLTAMALLFAIFSVKPSPFCILDEIDAPLDDTNVERLNRLIHEFEKRSQFIIITHNKVTMKEADRLFGVSMEEKGVSKILSLTFEGERVEALI